MSSLTYILGFSVRFFQPVYSIEEYYEIKITSKSFAQKEGEALRCKIGPTFYKKVMLHIE